MLNEKYIFLQGECIDEHSKTENINSVWRIKHHQKKQKIVKSFKKEDSLWYIQGLHSGFLQK